MSFIPGADGNKSIFKDGIQVDVISENTLDAGVHIKGMSDGTSVPTGYIGQVITINVDTLVATGTETNLASHNVPIGNWMIWWRGRITGSGKTMSHYTVAMNSVQPSISPWDASSMNGVSFSTTSYNPMFVVGPSLRNYAANTNLYLNAYLEFTGGGSLSIQGSWYFLRIA